MKRQFLQFSRRQSLHRSLFSLALLFGIFGGSVLVFSSGVFANDLTYQTSVPVEFTFNDYLNITVSGDLVISDLAPGTFADSNHIAVTVNTNNAYGYTLSATVGDVNNSSRDLRHSGYGTGGNTEVFSNLDLDANLTRETFSTGSTYDNKWGFSTDKAGSAYSGKYNGLPLYTNTEDTVVLDTSNYMPTDGTSTTNFWIGAKAPSDKVAGTYTNVVNFMVVGGEAPMGLAESYAAAGKTKISVNGGSYYKMQDMNSAICANTEVEESTLQVVDTRDNKVYWIAKLKDGKCWMLDNLALDLTNPTVLNGMNENNTHASNTTLGYLKGTTTRDPSTDPNGQYATAGVSNWTSSYSYSAPLVNMTNKDVVPQGDDPMASTVLAGNWKVGGYYNYCAASAGSYCYGNGTSSGTSSSGDATSDICPKGWRMPTGNSGEYQTLYSNTNYNTYDKYREALRLPLSGYFYDGSANDHGSYGYWWSSTRSNNGYMYRLYAKTSTIYPADHNYRGTGNSVRCVQGS